MLWSERLINAVSARTPDARFAGGRAVSCCLTRTADSLGSATCGGSSSVPAPRRGITLLDMLVALTALTTILLPIGMYLLEFSKGSNELGSAHKIMSVLEEKMEAALTQPFSSLPTGLTENQRLSANGREILDLRPVEIGEHLVYFSLHVETVPLEFSAVTDVALGKVERTRLEESMKRLTLKAVWGKKKEHLLDLVAYKADL